LNKALDQVYTPAGATGKFLTNSAYIKGAPNASKLLDEVPEAARPMANAILEDLLGKKGTGYIPYQSLRTMRSMVGETLKDTHLIGSRATGYLKQFYKALTADMEVVAQRNGFGLRFKRINDFYQAGNNRITDYLEKINGKASPEDIIQWISSGSARDSRRLAALRGSLKDPEAWEIVRRQVVRRLGIPTKGKALGLDLDGTFDMVEWAKNYTTIALKSPESKKILFPGASGAEYDKIAETINHLRDLKSPLVSPQTIGGRGLAAALMYSASAGVGTGVITGNAGLGLLAGIVAPTMAMMSINGAARLMTNPKFVSWLAKSIDLSPGSLPGHIARLGTIFKDDEDLSERDADVLIDFVDMLDAQEEIRNPEGDEALRGVRDLQADGL
jgi:hypothetical protein